MKFKKDDIVICINDNEPFARLTIGKEYRIIDSGSNFIDIQDDECFTEACSIKNFKSAKQGRTKLGKIIYKRH